MLLTKRSDYGLRAALELAAHHEDGARSAGWIAERGHLPEPFVKKLMQDLAAAGVVTPVRGRGGGYALSRPPGAISVRQVVAAFESLSPVSCLETIWAHEPDCEVERHAPCPMRPVWGLIAARLIETLEGLTLADLLQELGQTGWSLEAASHG